jgi:hypothetical protein
MGRPVASSSATSYGQRVPIGGGALSSKDPWRLDRAGAFRARQIALAIVDTGFVRDALVTFAWAPRDRRASHVEIVADGRTLPAHDVARWLHRLDPSLQITWEELPLATVNYENCARLGHFGRAAVGEADGTRAVAGADRAAACRRLGPAVRFPSIVGASAEQACMDDVQHASLAGQACPIQS